jgi:hypothetical protein
MPPTKQDIVEHFFERSGKTVATFARKLESGRPPPIIYHYTDDKGLRGILETGTMHFHDIFGLNDPSELNYGFSLSAEILRDKAKKHCDEIRTFAERYADFGLQRGIEASAHYFSCSFSACGDDLGQWRAYADEGHGFAIGFGTKALEAGFTTQGGQRVVNNCTFPVTYKEEKLRSIYEKITSEAIDTLLTIYREYSGQKAERYANELDIALTVQALRAAVFFKHKAYKNESEYRFLQIFRGDLPPPEVAWSQRPYSLTRYREFAWRDTAATALREIVVGPAAEYDHAAKFALDCLRAFHSGTVRVHRSAIPYRAPRY